MKKVLVIGVKGMAGHLVFKKLPQLGNYELYGIARNCPETSRVFDLDVSDTYKLKTIVQENQFDVIVNCIGILNKDAEDHPDKAIWFNAYFPHYLESITKETPTKVIHISTDCVFSGKKGGYSETDFKDGEGFYAQSKALGEIVNQKDVTLRTSIIGPELNTNGIGLFHWFMKQDNAQKLKGFTQAFWSGITTVELANVIHWAIQNEVTGLKQIAREKIDKYQLLLLFNEVFKNNQVAILSDDYYKVDKSLISTRTDFVYELPDYKQMLLEMKTWILNNDYEYVI
ncbi:MAG: SDR family oxidoreductase [Bacteroidota bacterium]